MAQAKWRGSLPITRYSPFAEEMRAQDFAAGKARLTAPGVDDGKAKAAGRHRVLGGRLVFVEGDLHARYAREIADLRHQRRWRVLVMGPVRTEQHDTEAVAAVAVGELPDAPIVKADHRLDPASAVEVGPLVAQPQMHLDHAAADGL